MQRFELRRRWRQIIQHLDHRLADQGDIGSRVIPEALTDALRHRGAEFDEGTVEILATTELETPHMSALQMLIQADGIGHGNELDHSFEQASGLEIVESFLQFPCRAHAR